MAKIKPRQEEKPKLSSSVGRNSTQHEKPIFSFEFLQDGFCITNCERDEKSQILDKLRVLGQLTWDDINGANKHKNGHEKIHRSSIRAPIPKNITGDIVFLAFRCIGKAPMVGFRKDRVFFVLWIDRACSLYDHG